MLKVVFKDFSVVCDEDQLLDIFVCYQHLVLLRGLVMQKLESKIPPPIVATCFAAIMWGLSLVGLAVDIGVFISGTLIALLV